MSGRKKPFELQVTVDFRCDLQECHFTEKTFRTMMKHFREWGIKRIYWLAYPWISGWWSWTQSPQGDENARRTYEEVGEFTAAAVRYAHEQDIEVYSEFKPFDMALPILVPHDFDETPAGKGATGGINALGGTWRRCADFIAAHPEFLIARNMTGIAPDVAEKTIRTIKLIKADDEAARINQDNLGLFVSNDNHHYHKYDKPYKFIDKVEARPKMKMGVNINIPQEETETVRVITFEGLDIKEPYLALQFTGNTSHPSFHNFNYRMIELYDEKNAVIPFAYGIGSPHSDGTWHLSMREDRFPNRGFMFDVSGDICNHPGYRFNEAVGVLDDPQKIIGIAKGKNPYHPALCAAYPEVRGFWLDMVKEYLNLGVDGVYFRYMSHQDTMEWDSYGFNQPVVDEYKKRFGVNILTEAFDSSQRAVIRGEFYSLFYREAKELLKKHGKPMIVDATNENYSDPHMPRLMNIYLDYKEWFKFVDGVILKNILFNRDVYHEIRNCAADHGLPTYVSFNAPMMLAKKNRRRIVDLFLKPLMEDGVQGVVMYESRTIWLPSPEGKFTMQLPEVPMIVVPYIKEVGRAFNDK